MKKSKEISFKIALTQYLFEKCEALEKSANLPHKKTSFTQGANLSISALAAGVLVGGSAGTIIGLLTGGATTVVSAPAGAVIGGTICGIGMAVGCVGKRLIYDEYVENKIEKSREKLLSLSDYFQTNYPHGPEDVHKLIENLCEKIFSLLPEDFIQEKVNKNDKKIKAIFKEVFYQTINLATENAQESEMFIDSYPALQSFVNDRKNLDYLTKDCAEKSKEASEEDFIGNGQNYSYNPT